MTADIVNLNRARKARARSEDGRRAEANRQKFGATKAERADASRAKADLDRKLDGAERQTSSVDDNDLDPGSVS